MPHCWAAKSSSTLCSFSLRLRYTEKAGSSMQLGKPWLPERKKVYDSCSGKVPLSSPSKEIADGYSHLLFPLGISLHSVHWHEKA